MFRQIFTFLAIVAASPSLHAQVQPDLGPWEQHSMDRPLPPIVSPGSALYPASTVPEDATVLFDGGNLDAWVDANGGPALWKISQDVFEVVPRTGSIRSKQQFGDVQLHIEWRAPESPVGSGQNRGNSGLFFMDRYEIQILDSWENPTYADGQAAAVYGQYPPLVNASRPPGEWQSYDVIFRRPRFNTNGGVVTPARMTVFHNGVLVQDASILSGPTGHTNRPPYDAHEDRLPISLQDHGQAVQFRNIWVRNLEP